MKHKGKLQFVQEFRKITAIQKLPTLKQGFGDIFFENKVDNNKFLRLKDQPLLTEVQVNYRNHQTFCQNQYIQSYSNDIQQLCKQHIQAKFVQLNLQMKDFEKWSHQLTQYIKQQPPKYSFKFKLQKASPPIPLSKELINIDPLTLELNEQSSKTRTKKSVIQSSQQPSSTSLNQLKKKRFDFNQITNYFISDDYKFEDLQSGSSDLIKKQLQLFKGYKNIKDIIQIEELKVDYDKFQYNINYKEIEGGTLSNERKPTLSIERKNKEASGRGGGAGGTGDQNNSGNIFNLKNQRSLANLSDDDLRTSRQSPKQYSLLLPHTNPFHNELKNFRYMSTLQNRLDMEINFFRDLGTVARNAQDFIKTILLVPDQQEEHNQILGEGEENPFIRQKIDTYLLHHLQPIQLKLDKSQLNFNDIANISMSRITSTNAHMCIRSEKITRGQYEKLLRKMEKLYKMQHQDGKTRQSTAVATDDLVQANNANKGGTKSENFQKNLTVHKLVDQINLIRKQAYSIRNRQQPKSGSSSSFNSSQTPKFQSFKFLNQRVFNQQIGKKLFSLLQQLFNRVCQELPFQYSILEIGFHIDEVNGLAEEYYDKKKLIWFIMTVLEEIEKGKSWEKNITYLQNKKRQDEPKVIKYKGEKAIEKTKLGTKNLYYNVPMALSGKDKSVSQNAYTPNKTNNRSKTPVKNSSPIIQKSIVKPSNSNNKTVSPIKTLTRNQNQGSKSPLKSSSNQVKGKSSNISPFKGGTTIRK